MIRSPSFRDRGVGIVAVLLIVLVLSLIGGVITMLVATGSVSKTNELVREQAFGLVNAGFEYALKRIDDGVNPDGETKNLGGGQFTVSYDQSGLITVTADVSAMQGAANPSFSIMGPPSGGSMADCLAVGVSGASMGGSYTLLKGLTLQNACNAAIAIASATVSWNPANGNRVDRFRIDGTNYNQAPGSLSGVPFDIDPDHDISACTADDLNYVRFTGNMGYRNYTITFLMGDGTQKQAFVQFVADDESACLNVDLSSAYVGGAGFTRLLDGTLTNSCSAPTVITVAGIAVSWTPVLPLRQLTRVRISGSGGDWDGSADSGAPISFSTGVELDAGETETQARLQFDGDMRGFNYNIAYTMGDDTTLVIPLNLYESDMAACLSVDASGCFLDGSDRNLRGQAWDNTCPLRIVVDRVRTAWTGGGSRHLQQIQIQGSDNWNGTANNGEDVDMPNADIAGGATMNITRYRFDNGMEGRCFTHAMTMFDGTTLSVPSFCP